MDPKASVLSTTPQRLTIREDQAFDVELISNLIEDMKKGKAAGLDVSQVNT